MSCTSVEQTGKQWCWLLFCLKYTYINMITNNLDFCYWICKHQVAVATTEVECWYEHTWSWVGRWVSWWSPVKSDKYYFGLVLVWRNLLVMQVLMKLPSVLCFHKKVALFRSFCLLQIETRTWPGLGQAWGWLQDLGMDCDQEQGLVSHTSFYLVKQTWLIICFNAFRCVFFLEILKNILVQRYGVSTKTSPYIQNPTLLISSGRVIWSVLKLAGLSGPAGKL